MINNEYSEAIVEVLDILKNSDDNVVKKIPKKLIEFLENNKAQTYKANLNHSKTLNEMNLKQKTKSILAMIYINYLCDSFEKENIQAVLKNNEEEYQKELEEKYNYNNIFKKSYQKQKVNSKVNTDQVQMIEYKKTIFKKIFDFIKKILNVN